MDEHTAKQARDRSRDIRKAILKQVSDEPDIKDEQQTFLVCIRPEDLYGICDACSAGGDFIQYCYCPSPCGLIEAQYLHEGHVVKSVWIDKLGNICFSITKSTQQERQILLEHIVRFDRSEDVFKKSVVKERNNKISKEIDFWITRNCVHVCSYWENEHKFVIIYQKMIKKEE